MRVAVLGTGTMGAPMARNIAKAGHDVVAYNRTRERAEPLAQDAIEVADGAAEAVRGADVVVTIVSDGDAVASLVDPALEAMGDAVWAQMSTVGVDGLERLMAMAGGAGVAFVDAPVSGTKQPAEQGTLVVLASGPPEARERCAPVFDAVGAKTVELGDEPGAATRMKLVLNAWLVALIEGLAESIQLAEGLGVDPAAFLEIIDGGPLGPPYAKLKGTMMIERSYEPSFALRWALKDAGLVEEAARAAGLDLPLARTIAERMQAAVDAGHGDDDMAATVEAGRG
ncbi:MAG: 3-hydroxyisobutyrate dehydrogenase [Solirubrobacteraceae bacterium]|jgi:3-hydroxyisobutyrate dehydrogenase|nr:3-hydroxyisobutyrate dehydrogenase [Solirubrobacteraceae bacterium]